jgi:hypothetical protein
MATSLDHIPIRSKEAALCAIERLVERPRDLVDVESLE